MSMKHNIYITLAIVLTIVAACTEHPIDQGPQVPDSSRTYIFFEPKVMEVEATKAELVEGGELPVGSAEKPSAFGVIGYYGTTSIFDAYTNGIAEVYRKGEKTSFQYDHLAWWRDRDENSNTKHNFYAFYPYSIHSSVKLTSGNPDIEYSLPSDADKMTDIMTADTSIAKVSSVPLEFKHRLWALDVEVVNRQTGDGYYQPGGTTPTSPELTVVSVKVTVANIPSAGTIKYDGSFTCNPDTPPTTIEYELPITDTKISPIDNPETIDVKENAATFVPLLFPPTLVSYDGVKVQYKLDFKFRNHWGDEYDQSFDFADFKLANGADSFEPGKRYKLTVVKTDTEASVDLDVTGWTEKDVTHTFN